MYQFKQYRFKIDRFKQPDQWQKMLRSTLYALLMLSMFWVPLPTDVSASVQWDEEPSLLLTCREKQRSTACTDPNTGTSVIVPNQHDVEKIEVTSVSLNNRPIPNSSPDDEFTAHRTIVGLSVIDSESDELLTKFAPALSIRVPYTRLDVRKAGGLRNLTLGYFDGQRMREFSDVSIRGNRRGGILVAPIGIIGIDPFSPCVEGEEGQEHRTVNGNEKPEDQFDRCSTIKIMMGGH